MIPEIEEHIKEIQDRLRRLPALSVALFSAACAERLWGAYEQFTTQNGWDCYPKVRRILDLCWETLAGQNQFTGELKTFLPELLEYVPHADDFTGLLSMGAQDFAGCLESTIKWLLNAPNARYGAPHCSLECLYQSVVRGLLDDPWVDGADSRIAADIIGDPAITKEFSAQESTLKILEENVEATRQVVDSIRASAVANRHRLGET